MPFKRATTYLTQYHEKRADDLYELKRPTWALTDAGSIPDFIALFDSDTENAEWEGLTANKRGDMNLVMGVRAKIAWLCGCRADLRRQFAAGKADRQRSAMDRQRFTYLHHRVRQKAVERLVDLLDDKRTQPITGK